MRAGDYRSPFRTMAWGPTSCIFQPTTGKTLDELEAIGRAGFVDHALIGAFVAPFGPGTTAATVDVTLALASGRSPASSRLSATARATSTTVLPRRSRSSPDRSVGFPAAQRGRWSAGGDAQTVASTTRACNCLRAIGGHRAPLALAGNPTGQLAGWSTGQPMGTSVVKSPHRTCCSGPRSSSSTSLRRGT